MQFYRDRLPTYNHFRVFWQVCIFIGSGASALLSTFHLTVYVAIVTSLIAAAASWLEVKDHGKKLERYTAAVRALKNLRDYWNSRGEVDKAGVDETSYLITTCENIIMNETRSWSSSIDTSEKKKKKTDSEALKDADKDAGDAPSTERRAAGNSG